MAQPKPIDPYIQEQRHRQSEWKTETEFQKSEQQRHKADKAKETPFEKSSRNSKAHWSQKEQSKADKAQTEADNAASQAPYKNAKAYFDTDSAQSRATSARIRAQQAQDKANRPPVIDNDTQKAIYEYVNAKPNGKFEQRNRLNGMIRTRNNYYKNNLADILRGDPEKKRILANMDNIIANDRKALNEPTASETVQSITDAPGSKVLRGITSGITDKMGSLEPGSILPLVVILLIFVFAIVPINGQGLTRLELMFLTLLGRQYADLNEDKQSSGGEQPTAPGVVNTNPPTSPGTGGPGPGPSPGPVILPPAGNYGPPGYPTLPQSSFLRPGSNFTQFGA